LSGKTGTAGGQSLLSYRYDNGIPGYTGFMSAGATISLPTKGSTLHVGRPASDKELQRWAGRQAPCLETEYKEYYKAKPSQYYPSMTEGGQWQAQRFGEVVTDARCNYNSSYKSEMQTSLETAKAAHNRTQSLRTTLAMGKQAQMKNITCGMPESKELGYKSIYSSMVTQDTLVGGPAAAGRKPGPVPDRSMEIPREKVVRRTLEPKFYGGSMYTQHYGAFGDDPLNHSAPNETEMAVHAVTHELAAGTFKGTGHIPGYSGFIPAQTVNAHALEKGHLGTRTRGNAKERMLLVAMDQYPRNLMPKYGGYRAKAVANQHAEDLPPTTRTHQGSVNHEVWRRQPSAPDKTQCLTSKDGTLSFFTGGAGMTSENGKALAECYYLAVRPYEGLPRIHNESKTTHWGSQFP
jgi:hypothetical protein